MINMSEQSIGYLKSKFEAGDVPSAQDFVDLIDSTYSVGVSSVSGAISVASPTVLSNATLSNFTTSVSATSGTVDIPSKAYGFLTLTVNGSSLKIPYFV